MKQRDKKSMVTAQLGDMLWWKIFRTERFQAKQTTQYGQIGSTQALPTKFTSPKLDKNVCKKTEGKKAS